MKRIDCREFMLYNLASIRSLLPEGIRDFSVLDFGFYMLANKMYVETERSIETYEAI